MESISSKIMNNKYNSNLAMDSIKRNIRKEFFPFVKNTERTKKTNNFPLCITLFVKGKLNKSIEERKSKIKINSTNLKPKELNLKSFNLNNLIKKRTIIKRNEDNSINSNLNINSFNSFNNIDLSKISRQKMKIKTMKYSPLNINSRNSSIIINQINFDKIPLNKYNKKIKNLPNNSLEYNDIPSIKNLKQYSFRKPIKSNTNFITKRRISSKFSPPLINSERKNIIKKSLIIKQKLKELKKLFQKDIKIKEKENQIIEKNIENVESSQINDSQINDNAANNLEISENKEELNKKEIKLDNITDNNNSKNDISVKKEEKYNENINENENKNNNSVVINKAPKKSNKFGALDSTFKLKENVKYIYKFYFLESQSKPNNNKFCKFLLKFEGSKDLHEQITFQKRKLLLNMENQIKKYSNNNRNNDLDLYDKFNEIDDYKGIILKDYKWKDEKNKLYQKNKKSNYNYSISLSMQNYLLMNYEFNDISDIYTEPKDSITYIKGKSKKNLSYKKVLDERMLKEGENIFKRNKTNIFNCYNNKDNDNNWMNNLKNIISINEISINEITIKENKYDSINKRIKNKFVTTRKYLSVNVDQSNLINKIHMLNRKKSIKPNKYMNLYSKRSALSILDTKKFFERIKNDKKIKNNKRYKLNKNKDEKFNMYFILLNYINKGDDKSFIRTYEKFKNKIDINLQMHNGNTFLIYCIKEGNLTLTKFLCSQECDVNIQNDLGNTALHYAIANQFFSIVDILKINGAREDILNNNGYAPWDCIKINCE